MFPVDGQPVADWTRQVATLPFPLRGDRSELPVFRFEDTADQVAAHEALADFRGACKERGALEERRLAYVAVTRARDLLLCSGYWWDAHHQAARPVGLLSELAGAVRATVAARSTSGRRRPADDDANPLTSSRSPPRGRSTRSAPRRRRVSAAAAARSGGAHGPPTAGRRPRHAARGRSAWDDELELLLAELDGTGGPRGPAPVVELPQPAVGVPAGRCCAATRRELARSLRRPLPAPARAAGPSRHPVPPLAGGAVGPAAAARRRRAARRGRRDGRSPTTTWLALQDAFDASEWAARVPAEVELPFDMVVDGLLLRGRCDAVFTDAPDGLVDVVDWKTGAPPTGAEARGRGRPAGRLPAGLAPPHRRAAGPTSGPRSTTSPPVSRSGPPTCSTKPALVGLVRSVPTG